MEVHHHSHTARKKWTHYLWEFLMLFLAVFCGFLAENQREHYIEAQRAKAYAKELFSDLKRDTADIKKGKRHISFYVSAIDSILSIASPTDGRTVFPGRFSYYCRLSTNIYPVDWNRSTLDQLIQSGSLRYFSNKNLVNKINQYVALQERLNGGSKIDEAHRETLRELRNKILDNGTFSFFMQQVAIDDAVDNKPLTSKADSVMRLQLPIQKGSEKYLDEFFNHLSERSVRLKGYTTSYFDTAINIAEEIMTLLKKEFHLK